MKPPLTIRELQKGLINKDFSAVELVDSYLSRISAFDKKINSFITVSDEQAYLQAKKIDKRIKNLGKNALNEYPLLGAVVAHKDMFLTKGLRTTAGSKVLESYVPAYSATVVERLNRAGCITIGKLNQDAWAHGASGENSDFGATKNPWNVKHVPGGSSSGSAAALSSNFCLISTGTDTAGSVRQPASFCGVAGLKPTYGAVSRYGVIAMASSLDTVGHMGHCVNDVESVFNSIKGPDGKDGNVREVNGHESSKNGPIKIGLPKEYFLKGIDREVEEAVKNAADVLKKQGAEIAEVSLPHTKYAISVYYTIMPAEVSSNLGRYDGIRYGNKRESFADEAKRRIMLGTYALSVGYHDKYYTKAVKVRNRIREDFDVVFKKVDLLLTPVSPTAAFKLDKKVNDPMQMYLSDVLTAAANLAGIPGLSIPTGLSKTNLPLGFQLMGPPFSEPLLFRVAKSYEKAVDWRPLVANL